MNKKVILALDNLDLGTALSISNQVKDKLLTVKVGLELYNLAHKTGIKNSLPFIRSQIDAKIDSELMNDEKWDEYTKEHSSCICKNSTENYQFSSDKAMKSNNFYSDLKEEYNANNDAFWENNKMSMYNDLQKTKFIEMIDVLEKA